MDKTEFEAALRNDGYRMVNTSVPPNKVVPNHCHDFDAKVFVLGGDITITRDVSFGPDAKNVVDVFEPEQGKGGRPVLIYVPGGLGNKRQGGQNGSSTSRGTLITQTTARLAVAGKCPDDSGEQQTTDC